MKYLQTNIPILLIFVAAGCGAAPNEPVGAAAPTTVLLVRHAERADDSDNSRLSEAGEARSELLARMLEDSRPEALFATQYVRTQETLRPLAERLGLPIQILPAESSQELVQKILTDFQGETVVVASHSDRVPVLVEELTGVEVEPVEHTEYSRLYVLTVFGQGQGKALELRFGAADPESSPGMMTTQP